MIAVVVELLEVVVEEEGVGLQLLHLVGERELMKMGDQEGWVGLEEAA